MGFASSDRSAKQKAVIALNVVFAIIIAILLILIILFSTTFMSITVKGNSMLPTLEDGNKLILLKHGYKLNRGDIIVLKKDDRNNVKRILGLEGDVIQFDLDEMTWIVNGKKYEENYIKDGYSENYFSLSDNEVFEAIFSKEGYVVKQGHVFVLGDNRNIHDGKISVDSHTYGALNTSNIIGKVIKIY